MNKLRKNYLYNATYQLLSILTPLITSPYISRILKPQGIGIYTYTYSVAGYFLLVAMLGVSNYGNRTIAQAGRDKPSLSRTFLEIYLFQAGFGSLLLALYLLYCFFFAGPYRLCSLLQSFHVLSAVLDVSWFFYGLEEFKIIVLRNTVIKIAGVASIFLFIKDAGDIALYCFLMAFSAFLSQVLMWPILLRRLTPVPLSGLNIIRHIKPNLTLFIPMAATSIYKMMDKLLVGKLCDMSQLGYYENADKVVSMPMSLITALGNVMLPRMTQLYHKGEHGESLLLIRKSMLFVGFLSMAVFWGIVSVAPVFVPVFFGGGYEESIPLVSFLSVTVIFVGWSNVIRTQYLIPRQKDGIFIGSILAGASVNLLLNLLLIPRYRSAGAVVGTIFAELTVCLVQTLAARGELEFTAYLKMFAVFCGAGGLMFGVVRLLPPAGSPAVTLLSQIAAGAAFYLACAGLIILLKKNGERR